MNSLKAFPTVSVIVLNHNGMSFLKDCLDSLLAATYPDTELLMVDNGSTDESVSFVERNYPTVTVIHSGGNIGYSAANPLGIRLMGPVSGPCVLVGWLIFRHYTLPDQVGRPVEAGQEL